MTSLEDITAAIAAIDDDAALCSALKARLQKAAPNFSGMLAARSPVLAAFPDPATITAAQMSVFDNWIEFGGTRPKRGHKGHNRDRWKATIEVWTQPAADLDLKKHKRSFYGVAHLWTGTEISKRASGSNKALKLPKALSEPFKDQITAQAESMTTELLGLVYSPDGGYYLYHDSTFVAVSDVAELEAHGPSRILIDAPSGSFIFEGFARTTAKGNALPQNCFAHSRMTTVPNIATSWNAVLIGGEATSG